MCIDGSILAEFNGATSPRVLVDLGLPELPPTGPAGGDPAEPGKESGDVVAARDPASPERR